MRLSCIATFDVVVTANSLWLETNCLHSAFFLEVSVCMTALCKNETLNYHQYSNKKTFVGFGFLKGSGIHMHH